MSIFGCCRCFTKGALSPIPATDDMTQEVGARGMKLYTKPIIDKMKSKVIDFNYSAMTTIDGHFFLNVTTIDDDLSTFDKLWESLKKGRTVITGGRSQVSTILTAVKGVLIGMDEIGVNSETNLPYFKLFGFGFTDSYASWRPTITSASATNYNVTDVN